VIFNRYNSDCERINTLNSANLEEGLLSVKDLARILNCGRTMAWALIHTRKIPSIRIGRLVRISPEDLDAYIRKNRS
jgi:excisionase family DNA binding protein